LQSIQAIIGDCEIVLIVAHWVAWNSVLLFLPYLPVCVVKRYLLRVLVKLSDRELALVVCAFVYLIYLELSHFFRSCQFELLAF
jgi:hypothetical protein